MTSSAEASTLILCCAALRARGRQADCHTDDARQEFQHGVPACLAWVRSAAPLPLPRLACQLATPAHLDQLAAGPLSYLPRPFLARLHERPLTVGRMTNDAANTGVHNSQRTAERKGTRADLRSAWRVAMSVPMRVREGLPRPCALPASLLWRAWARACFTRRWVRAVLIHRCCAVTVVPTWFVVRVVCVGASSGARAVERDAGAFSRRGVPTQGGPHTTCTAGAGETLQRVQQQTRCCCCCCCCCCGGGGGSGGSRRTAARADTPHPLPSSSSGTHPEQAPHT